MSESEAIRTYIRLGDPYSPEANAVTFDLDLWAETLDPNLLTSKELRVEATKYDPFLFAMLYLSHHLKINGEVSFSDAHLDWVRQAQRMVIAPTRPQQHRDTYVAPRSMGKSTWWFTIIPLWLAAHGHSKFLAAFADSALQAETHLATFKTETDTNKLIREDYPLLCKPQTRPQGTVMADNRGMLFTKSGFVFAARGVDAASLGMKVGAERPDLIILDDIEPTGSGYSHFQAQKRLDTLLEAILPLNVFARVVVAGTVTMEGSIVHQLVKGAQGGEVEAWVKDGNFRSHYYPAIVEEEGGTQRSIWPQKWPLDWMLSQSHTREFAKNYMNAPLGTDGTYWTESSFHLVEEDDPREYLATYLSIDPAVTSGKKADYTGFAVVSYRANPKGMTAPEGLKGEAILRHSSHRRITPGPDLRAYVLKLLSMYPETVKVLVETNQGGEMWSSILHSLPVRLEAIHQKTNKDVRAAQLLTDYDMGRVLHDGHHADIENEMLSFSGQDGGGNDDMIDAVGTAVEYLRNQERLRIQKKLQARNTNQSATYA